MKEVAAKRGVKPPGRPRLGRCTRPSVTAPIIGASKPDHLDDAFAALSITLDAEEVKALEAPYRPHAVLGHS